MQLKKLHLIRYGHFQNRELEFADSGLTVVYGPNEAGKSTSLSAISDFLYGMDRSCPYNFKFPYSDLRLGGTVTNNSGNDLSFLRRKANSATILDAGGTALPDSVLGPYLGQSDKEFFQKSFGLSHERLRQGGEAIERAEGDLGKVLFEAGSGITQLAEIQKMLEEGAEQIFTPRRVQSRLLYQSIDKYWSADASLKAASLKSQDWQNAQRQLDEARQSMETLQNRHRGLTARQAKLNRWLRVLPILREINTHRVALQATGSLVALSEDAGAKYEKSVFNRTHADHLFDETQKRLEHLLSQAEACAINHNLLHAGDGIQRLYEHVGVIEQLLEALPLTRSSIAELRQQMVKQAERLNLPMADGAPLLPKVNQSTNLTTMVAQRQQLDTRLKKAMEDEAGSALQIDQLQQQLVEFSEVTDPGPDTAIFQKLQTGLAALPDEARLEKEISKQDKKIAAALAKLPWWTGESEGLLKLRLPTKAQIELLRKAIAAAEKQTEVQTDKLEDAVAEVEKARRKLDSFRKRQTFHTEDDLSKARGIRQEAWILVRRVLDNQGKPTAMEIARFKSGEALVPVYETLSQQADEIADARLDSVGKEVRYETLQEELRTHEQQAIDLRAKFNKAKADLDSATASWNELWRGIDIKAEPAEVMLESLSIVETIADAVVIQEEAAAERYAAKQLKEKILQQLQTLATRFGIETPMDADADVLVIQIENALTQKAEAFRKVESLVARQAEQKQMHEKHKRDLVQLNAAIAKWQQKWSTCCTHVSLSPELSTVQVTDAIAAWNDLAQKQADLERRESELHQAKIQVQQFTETSCGLINGLRLDGKVETAAEAIQAVRKIYGSYVAMQQMATRHAELEKQVVEVKEALENHAAAIAATKAEMHALMDLAGAENEADLPAAIGIAEQQRHLQNEIVASRKRLLEASEGEDENSLVAACGDLCLDDVRAELNDASTELVSLNLDLETVIRKETEAKREFEDLEAKSGAAECAQVMQNAVARMAVQARDYLRLQAASALLRQGIERVRDRHKNPILAKASDFFSTLTTGSFAGLTTDYDTKGNPIIVGVRPTGEQLNVSGMSEGTRDQLYLALRLAFVENYCANEEPLPFIGDDLFINFDEERTAAGLQLLSQLKHCQVIMFTHHEHVKDLAKQEPTVLAHDLGLANNDTPNSWTLATR